MHVLCFFTTRSIVEYNFTVSHKENSDAHVVDVQVVWMLPAYVKYLHINQKSRDEMSYTSENNIIFKVKLLFNFLTYQNLIFEIT